jgi:hypothetical protein
MNTHEIQNISNGDAGVNRTAVAPDFSWVATLFANDPNGKLMPVDTGKESDSALRDLAIYFAEGCPASHLHPRCPFRVLSDLYPGSLKTLVNGMTRAALLSLFEMERELRRSSAGPATGSELVLTN